MEGLIVVWRIELEAPMILFPFLAVGLYQEWAENAREMAGFLGGGEGRRSCCDYSTMPFVACFSAFAS